METYYRDTWVEIQLDAIKHNIQSLNDYLPDKTGIYAVVKANGYGHGDIQVAKTALASGAQALAVSLLDEALKLRKAGISAPILVLGWVRPCDAPLAAAHNIMLTFFQEEWLQQVKQYKFKERLTLHMKWDTGMGRIGVRTIEEMDALLTELDDPRLHLQGVFTHFASADECNLAHYTKQVERFHVLLQAFCRRWKYPVELHTGNSAASMRFPEQMHHKVRFGIGMYGLPPSDVVKDLQLIQLQPAFSLHSKLIHVKKVEKGESISYGATYTTEENEWIGTVPLGYADGWMRKLQGIDVLINGKRMPIVGRICMDQLMVKLDQFYPIGTKVTFIGKQGDDIIKVEEIARYADTINYEITCMISYRVPRVYVENDAVVQVDHVTSY
ncbi:alanine racemase [Pontibacillus litoralis JSM 072002]|uniref:Alanine racemase n=1 Tax=Pontibacillus litoralis JSM 072002 TaxID=1385512 RepID=A0A0A5HSH8_9BACI|nr:alanine racemase [Pontibacillus litoralis JSM 072002]